ncbi:hypothetical protein BKA18_007288 [Streptomyces auratus]
MGWPAGKRRHAGGIRVMRNSWSRAPEQRMVPLDLDQVLADGFDVSARRDGLYTGVLGRDGRGVVVRAVSSFGDTWPWGAGEVDLCPAANGQDGQAPAPSGWRLSCAAVRTGPTAVSVRPEPPRRRSLRPQAQVAVPVSGPRLTVDFGRVRCRLPVGAGRDGIGTGTGGLLSHGQASAGVEPPLGLGRTESAGAGERGDERLAGECGAPQSGRDRAGGQRVPARCGFPLQLPPGQPGTRSAGHATSR